jgi:hypothetical protein
VYQDADPCPDQPESEEGDDQHEDNHIDHQARDATAPSG